MACEDIEERLQDLRRQKAELEAAIDKIKGGAGRQVAEENLANLAARIAMEEKNLASCKAAAAAADATVDGSFTGYVGTIEAETRGQARLWFGLTSDASGANWLKEANKRVWLTMDMESADRPSHMAQLTLLLEAMRNGLQVRASHSGVAPGFFKEVAGDSYEVNGVRVLRAGLKF